MVARKVTTVAITLLALASPGMMAQAQYTHTVLAEQCTATWCPYCPPVAGYLKELLDSGLYQFHYLALVADMSGYANNRRIELGCNAYPWVFFDGGRTSVRGNVGWTGPYIDALNYCGGAPVADVDLKLSAEWLGDGKIKVTANLKNNESKPYNGRLRIYVTEISSRWNDYWGRPYGFAWIGDYVYVSNVTVPANDFFETTQTWDGSLFGFGDIKMDNIKVIASVFDQSTNYTDETAAAKPTKWKKGDTNCDDQVNFADITPFVLALSDPDEYKRQYPDCDLLNADCNDDGDVNFADINPFVDLLSS